MMENAPKYISVYNLLKEDILSGKYGGGTYLPPEAKLQEQYDASRTTIRRAISLLRDEQLVDPRQGSGTIVMNTERYQTNFKKVRDVRQIYSKFMIEGECETSSPGSVVDQVSAAPKVAKALGVVPGTPLYRLQHIESVNGTPFAYMTNYLKTELFPCLDQYSGKIVQLYEFLFEHYSVHYLSSEETITAVACGFLESKLLGVDTGTPLMLFERVAICDAGAFEYAETIVRPDIFRIVLRMGNAEQ